MRRLISLLPVLLAAISLAYPLPVARAAITATGDISPANPSSWTRLCRKTSIGTLSEGIGG